MDASQAKNKGSTLPKKGKKSTAMVVAKRPTQRPVASVPRSVTPKQYMSKCGQNYMHALYDPFTVQDQPCVPSLLPLPSQKIRVLTRGAFQLSTAGYGGCAMWPYRMQTRDFALSGLNVLPAVVTSNNTTADTDFKFTNLSQFDPAVVTGVNAYAGLTSPYTAADLDSLSGRAVKLVAAGIRVTYEDKEIDRSGVYVTWRNPAVAIGLPITADDLPTLLAYNLASQTRVSDLGSAGASYLPVIEQDLQAIAGSGTAGNIALTTSIGSRLACAVMIANGQPGARYAFEAVAHFEVYGKSIPTTPSHSDVQSVSTAIGAATNITPSPDLGRQLVQAVSNAKDRAAANGFDLDLGNLARLLYQAGVAYAGTRLKRALPGMVRSGVQLLL